MQLTQKHAFWRITRQNRSNGLTPSGAKERTKNKKVKKMKKAQTINISPLRGDHAPESIDMSFSVLTPVTDVIIPAKFCVDPLKGFWEGAPPKVPFPIVFGTTVTTVLHYRADCDTGNHVKETILSVPLFVTLVVHVLMIQCIKIYCAVCTTW